LLNGSVYFATNGKNSVGTICYSNCIHLCPDSTYSVEFVLLVARWT